MIVDLGSTADLSILVLSACCGLRTTAWLIEKLKDKGLIPIWVRNS